MAAVWDVPGDIMPARRDTTSFTLLIQKRTAFTHVISMFVSAPASPGRPGGCGAAAKGEKPGRYTVEKDETLGLFILHFCRIFYEICDLIVNIILLTVSEYFP